MHNGQWVCRSDPPAAPAFNPMASVNEGYAFAERLRSQAPQTPAAPSASAKNGPPRFDDIDAKITGGRCDLAAALAVGSGDDRVMRRVLERCLINPAS